MILFRFFPWKRYILCLLLDFLLVLAQLIELQHDALRSILHLLLENQLGNLRPWTLGSFNTTLLACISLLLTTRTLFDDQFEITRRALNR